MSNLTNNVFLLNEELKGNNVKVVAISKTYTIDQVRTLYNLGIKDFGENRSNLLLEKKEELKDLDITWHFVGHLQSNKVKEVINEIDYLHSLERLSLAKAINKHRLTPLKCFIQVNIVKEESKHGVYLEDLITFINNLKKYDKIEIVGFMAMGVNNDLSQTEKIFKKISEISKLTNYHELSMGMSDDYKLALKYNTTFIRVGRMLVR